VEKRINWSNGQVVANRLLLMKLAALRNFALFRARKFNVRKIA